MLRGDAVIFVVSKEGETLKYWIRSSKPFPRDPSSDLRVNRLNIEPGIAQQLDQRHPVVAPPILQRRTDRRQTPMRAIAAVCGLAYLAQQAQGIAQQLLKFIQYHGESPLPQLIIAPNLHGAPRGRR